MWSQRRKRLGVISAVSFLFSICLTGDAFAISLENNVDVSWSEIPGCPNKSQCKVPVKGAPRLVVDGLAAGLKITVSERGGTFKAFKIILKARLFNHSLLDEVPDVFVFDFSGASKAFYEQHEGGILSLREFERGIGNNFGIFGLERKSVFTVEGIFFASFEPPGWNPLQKSVSLAVVRRFSSTELAMSMPFTGEMRWILQRAQWTLCEPSAASKPVPTKILERNWMYRAAEELTEIVLSGLRMSWTLPPTNAFSTRFSHCVSRATTTRSRQISFSSMKVFAVSPPAEQACVDSLPSSSRVLAHPRHGL